MADLPKKEDHQYIIRNCIANFYCTVLPFIEIIGFVWKKVPKQSFEQYFNSFSITKHVGGSKKAEKIWRERNKELLKKDSFETCDVTFLYTILPIICRDKIVVFDTPEHEEKLKDKSTVEWHLKQIKEMRNSFSHQRQNISSKVSFTKLKNLIRNCLIAACKLYEITNQVEIDQMTDEADDKFETIIRDITSDRQSRVIFLKDLILSDCIDKMKEKVTNMNISLPGNSKIKIDLSHVFKNIYLRDLNANFECRTLLTKISKKINIIEGRSGSGKTTLLKNVQRSVILEEQSDFESCNIYRLALLISCQTNNETHLGDNCKALLPDVFATFDKDEVLDSIRLIDGVLFLIDGYDEVNEQSRKLTNSAIEFCSNSGINASCIISSRIKAANGLTKHLDRRDLDYNVITIDKIEDQNEQTELIRSYGEQLPDVNKKEAVVKFISLNQKVKDVFNTPLLLAFFSTLYKTLGNESEKIKEVDVFRGIYRQILDGIYPNFFNDEDSASTIMDIIGKHCLHVIGLDKTVFGKEEYEKLKASCKIASPTVVNMDNLLDIVLLPKIPDNILHDTTYTFIHFSIHEFFASVTLEEKLKDFPGVISRKEFFKILDLSPPQFGKNIGRYQNVFRFLILRLHSTGEIEKIAEAMSEIMARDIKPDIPYCLDLISDTEHDDAIIKMMSAAIACHLSFAIDGVSDLKSLVQALYHAQNNAKKGTNDLNSGQTKSLALNMRKSHDEYEVVVDDIFVKLKKIKCTITLFRGCLVTDFSLHVLASKLASTSRLYISCPSAIGHKMKILEGKTDNVNAFTFKYCDNFTPGDKNPLPRNRNGSHSRLYITDSPAHSQEHVFKMICGLAPTNSDEKFYTFAQLYLLRCFLSASETVELVVKFSATDFTTYNEGVTRSFKSSSERNEYCVACRSNHTEENRTCYELQLSKSDYVRHLDLICAADFSETAIKREEPAVKKYAEYRVKKIDHLTSLIKVLNYSHQSSAHSSGVEGNKTKSGEKAGKTKVIKIELLNSYRNFQPLSDCIFQDLQPVRCNIEKFIGCLDSTMRLNVLKSKLIKTSAVLISPTTVRNHQLNILNGVKIECVMQFMFKYEGESLGDNSYPLPRLSSGCPPILRVTDTPTDSLKTVCSFISSLAPVKSTKDSSTFFQLFLARCSLPASEVKELAKKLSAKNLLTENEGVTRALELSPARTEYCEACHANHKENNVICYQLQLAK